MHNGNVIDSFRGKYRFLSNFHPAPVTLDGVEYPTVEHAYQAAKTLDPARRNLIRLAKTAAEAKSLGRTPLLVIRRDWDSLKVDVMKDLVRQKFEHPDLSRQLAGTRNALLIEGNTWGDTFWGICNRVGQNWLGRILMERRSDLASSN